MAVTTRTQWASDLLINYVTMEIKTLEPLLLFARMGVQKDVPMGFDQLVFPQTNQIATSSVSTIVPAGLGEGVNPSAVTWGSVAYKSGLTQYGLIVQVTDILVRNSAIEVVDNAIRQTRLALARQLDAFIQTVANGSTTAAGIVYAGGKASRAALTAGDLIDQTLVKRAVRILRGFNVDPYEGGFYWALAHPFSETDLMSNTSTGSYLDMGRYTSVDDLKVGKYGGLNGIRLLASANVQTFSSNVTVYPVCVGGFESFGWGYFQQPTPVITMTPDSNNPLNLYSTLGGKAAIGATRFEDSSSAVRIVRIESAVSS